MTNWAKVLGGFALVGFALIPDPTDTTVIIPLTALTGGVALISSGLKDKKGDK